MNTQKANYECIRGHVTAIPVYTEKVRATIICTCNHKGNPCKETAWYQPTDAELDAAAMEELANN